MVAFPLVVYGEQRATNTDSETVVFAQDGKAVCEIHFSTNVSEKPKEYMLGIVRRFQTYLQRLSGAKIPIVDDPPGGMLNSLTNSVVSLIHIDAEEPPGQVPYAYQVFLARPESTAGRVPILFIRAEPDFEGSVSPNKNVLYKLGNVEKAIDAFVRQCFGIPLSAVDDPKFDWSTHHQRILAISFSGFHSIEYTHHRP